jgi:hypothetical protein
VKPRGRSVSRLELIKAFQIEAGRAGWLNVHVCTSVYSFVIKGGDGNDGCR